MSKFNWRNGFAVGLIAFGYSVAEGKPSEPITEPNPSQEQSAEKPAVEPTPTAGIVPTDPSGNPHDDGCTEHTDEAAAKAFYPFLADGAAQWIMAILGLVATFLSGWAVGLLHKTLKATRDAVVAAENGTAAAQAAVTATEQIGYKQVRANLSYAGADIKYVPDVNAYDLLVTLKFLNSGASPARDICYNIDLTFTPQSSTGGAPPPAVPAFDERKVKGTTRFFCGAGREFKPGPNSFQIRSIEEHLRVKSFYYILGTIRYKDDFFSQLSDYRYVKFCLIVQGIGGFPIPRDKSVESDLITVSEHGPDNYAD